MTHKPFENWILDDTPLSKAETILLKNHLKSCQHCSQLQSSWMLSKTRFLNTQRHAPLQGFTQRWQTFQFHRRELERARLVRRNLFFLVAVMVLASIIYMIQKKLLAAWIVSALSMITSLFFNISKVLAGFNFEMTQSPFLFYGVTLLVFGATIAALGVLVFFIWNLLNKREQEKAHEVEN